MDGRRHTNIRCRQRKAWRSANEAAITFICSEALLQGENVSISVSKDREGNKRKKYKNRVHHLWKQASLFRCVGKTKQIFLSWRLTGAAISDETFRLYHKCRTVKAKKRQNICLPLLQGYIAWEHGLFKCSGGNKEQKGTLLCVFCDGQNKSHMTNICRLDTPGDVTFMWLCGVAGIIC